MNNDKDYMKNIEQNGIYFISGIKEIITSVGGQSNDFKERPIVALVKSNENPDIFWIMAVFVYSGNIAVRLA